MDLTQIRYFLAVAETLNFTRAAERCKVTQPALTRAVQRLEEELGGPLLLRERAFTQLTALGRAMLPLLRQTAEAAEAVRTGAAGYARRDGPVRLRLGVERGLPVAPVVPLLREVLAHVAAVELTLAEDTPEALVAALLEGALDVALLPETGLPERLSRWPLWTRRVVALLPDGHRLAAQEEVTRADLAGETLLALPDDGCWPDDAPARSAAHGCCSVAGLEALVALGLGIGLVPAGAPRLGGCVERPLERGLARSVMLALPAGRPLNAAVGAFVKLARARRWEPA
jgi:DNA-binding transcriptional LysR family regulator